MEQDETEPPLLHKHHCACNGCSGPNIDIAWPLDLGDLARLNNNKRKVKTKSLYNPTEILTTTCFRSQSIFPFASAQPNLDYVTFDQTGSTNS